MLVLSSSLASLVTLIILMVSIFDLCVECLTPLTLYYHFLDLYVDVHKPIQIRLCLCVNQTKNTKSQFALARDKNATFRRVFLAWWCARAETDLYVFGFLLFFVLRARVHASSSFALPRHISS